MITEIIEIKDFLLNPDEVIKAAKLISFYSVDTHPKTLDLSDLKLCWDGMRSDSIYQFDKKLSDDLFDRVFCKITEKAVGDYHYSMRYEYNGNCSFHYFTEHDAYNDSWVHNDNGSLFAGVLYLNKNAPENTGTVVIIDGEHIKVENEYNKLVLYPAHLLHYAQGGFGKDVNDARLTSYFLFQAFHSA